MLIPQTCFGECLATMPTLTPAEKVALQRAVSVQLCMGGRHRRERVVPWSRRACPALGVGRTLRTRCGCTLQLLGLLLCLAGILWCMGLLCLSSLCLRALHPLRAALALGWDYRAAGRRARCSQQGANNSAVGLCAQLEFGQCQRPWLAAPRRIITYLARASETDARRRARILHGLQNGRS